MTLVKAKPGIAKTRWAPPPRPYWVRLLNQVGSNLGDGSALVPLDEASLIGAAQRFTGLDDFGDEAWREPFAILLADIENEANLNLTGRLLTRYDLVRSLVFRLRMAEAEKRQPQILDEEIREPIIVAGLGRTGTSILHELMAQDPRLRAPLGWEMRYPAVLPDDEDSRVAMTAAEVDLWLEVVPEFAPIHEIAVDGPDEDSVGHEHAFASQVWGATNRAPNFDMWMATKGWTQAFAFERRLLQHLQFRRPGRWILKGVYSPCLRLCSPSSRTQQWS